MAINQFDTIVTRQEAEALKEMIFKRVRERAEVLANDTNEKYTTDARFDVMELAHTTFNQNNNPFAKIVDNQETPKVEESQQVGFSVRENKTKEVVRKKTDITTKEFVEKAIELSMEDSRKEIVNKASFMGALDFLNSQASISLVNRSKKSFDALA